METIIAVVSPLASFPASPNSISSSSSQQHASHLKITKLHHHHPQSFLPTHSFTANQICTHLFANNSMTLLSVPGWTKLKSA